MKNENDFEYSYSAPTSEERKEIESIRKSYLELKKSQSKLDLLRRLDWKIKNIPFIFALAIGILGTLIFGLGMTFILEWNLLVWGIIICVIALIPILLAYPLNNILTAKMKNKYRESILKLSEELLNDKNN